jgi:hypothetical protein
MRASLCLVTLVLSTLPLMARFAVQDNQSLNLLSPSFVDPPQLAIPTLDAQIMHNRIIRSHVGEMT